MVTTIGEAGISDGVTSIWEADMTDESVKLSKRAGSISSIPHLRDISGDSDTEEDISHTDGGVIII